ncbi:MAG: hypothetical protein K6F30_00290 [Lachnospiraceae bacterium]|nr:hypothetical protein [Lachnospiraceae bacterium]
MTALQIALFITGLICFIGSFFFTEKLSSSDTDLIKKLSEKEVKGFVDEELKLASEKIDKLLDEKIEVATERIEVATDKDTNQKLMSIGEYSDTILETMNKSHDEIMFIYQMLNDKQENITSIVSEIQTQESVLRNIKASVDEKLKELEDLQITVEQKQEEIEENEKLHFESDVLSLKEAFIQKLDESEANKEVNEPAEKEASSKDELKDKILSMHKDGYSEVEIAKTCGVGIGEIKLILGLYDGV